MATADLIADHGYLVAALIGLPGAALAIVLAGRLRWSIVVAGLVGMVLAPPVILFDATYWTPTRIGGGMWGSEDILVSFSLGAGVWFAAIVPWRGRLLLSAAWGPALRRLAAIATLTTLTAIVVHTVGASNTGTLVIVMAATAVVLGAWRPVRLRYAAAALLLYPPYYVLVLFAAAALVPGFFSIWNGPELSGVRIAGLPIEEIVFVAAFSVSFPLIMATVLDADCG
ncbi:lycopene cyclase domain-containing protein [Aurantimonas marianensis]|uniref:Lycopene cyclase domain-containing protein n=1 Tax=Aurantimonas marianensis TaxID=2920428 RepID=A0A9X2HEG5_9HYPH|nr:lycopene cyclase domain-containing protein [Aurantimonas marianensis]MCP3056972.1 lycopene cyclase domain-containing protein [Aurantimonas marianensis]